ncbi:MAG: hypothetical protein A3D57_05580 [Candidatus Sungbacteria bacterium RIFCSPHIGHO2_02_FULL_46_12]|nr:MAG: hypothetical protein A3D57_05580 [Candidatus Sungbacteria bacterium RIFCSPHIGHO2_02_FULL_46_12]
MIEKTKFKTYGSYLVFFICGITFFILVPTVVLFLISLTGYAVVPLKIPLATTAIIDGGIIFLVWKRKRSELFIILASLVVAIIIINTLVIKYSNTPRINTHDNRRIADIKQLELAVELYFNYKGGYPPTTSGCYPISVLDSFLSPDFITRVPRERFEEIGHDIYQYGVSPDGSQVVLKAALDKERPVLKSDLDGNVFGCNCDDPNYCIRVNK